MKEIEDIQVGKDLKDLDWWAKSKRGKKWGERGIDMNLPLVGRSVCGGGGSSLKGKFRRKWGLQQQCREHSKKFLKTVKDTREVRSQLKLLFITTSYLFLILLFSFKITIFMFYHLIFPSRLWSSITPIFQKRTIRITV